MKIIIQTVNGMPVGEALAFDNMKQIYYDLDYDNLPSNFKKLIRDPRPDILGPYEKYDGTKKILEGDYVREIHVVVEMTPEEKSQKLEQARQIPQPYPSWTFSEDHCRWMAPVPEPEEEFEALRQQYPNLGVEWNEPEQRWEFIYA